MARDTEQDQVGNTRAQARDIGIDSPFSYHVSYAGDVDFFRIYVPFRAQYTITLEAGFGAWIRMWHSNGNLFTDGSTWSSTAATLAIREILLRPGANYIEVRGSFNPDRGSYTLTVTRDTEQDQVGNTRAQAREIDIDRDLPFSHHVSYAGDVDFFRFYVPFISHHTVTLEAEFGAQLSLRSSAGTLLATRANTSNTALTLTIQEILLRPGTHYIEVRGSNHIWRGNYTLAIQTQILVPPTSISIVPAGTQTLSLYPIVETVQLRAIVQPAGAGPINWHSEHPSIATVDQNGLVTAVSRGTTIIRVYAGDRGGDPRASVVIRVLPAPVNIIYDANTPPGTMAATGSLPSNQRKYVGDPVDIANNAGGLRRDGYILLGWSTPQTRTNRSNPQFRLGQRDVYINNPGDVTLYAHWGRLGWSNIVDVDVFLYADEVFGTSAFWDGWSSYVRRVRSYAEDASDAFRYTFGINMSISSNVTRVRSQKYYCDDPAMVSPYFLCAGRGDNCGELSLQSLWDCCTSHHSSGRYMLYRFSQISNVVIRPDALHLMFFAGRVCFYRTLGDPETHRPYALGFGQRPGNVSTASSGSRSKRIVQHEWSHNYGAHDRDDCLAACIMTSAGVFSDILQALENVWCTRCRLNILAERARRHGIS